MNGDIPVIDSALTLVFSLYFYFIGPAKHIKNTPGCGAHTVKMAIGLKRDLIRQYWKVPLVLVAVLAEFFLFCFALDLPCLIQICSDFIANHWKTCNNLPILAWPLIIWWRRYSKRTDLEKWKQEDLEHRIASGMASSRDIRGYMQGVKKREYEKGYLDGRSSSSPNISTKSRGLFGRGMFGQWLS